MKKTAREIELKIPVEIYNKILDEVEQLRADTEEKIAELRKFEENILKTINNDRENNKKSIEKFEKKVRDYIEQKNIMTFRDLRNKIEKYISDMNKKYSILENSVKKNFENEGNYILKIMKDMDKKINNSNNNMKEMAKMISSISKELNSVKRTNEKFKKDLQKKDEKIKKLEEELKSMKEWKKTIEKELKENIEIIKKNPLTIGMKKIKKARTTKKKTEMKMKIEKKSESDHKKSQSLFEKILPFVKSKKTKESPIARKIDSIRRRKKGKDYIVGIAHILRDFIKKKYGIKEQLTYTELIDRIDGIKDMPKDVREQLTWFFNEVQQHEYSGELDEVYFPDLDKWAKKIVELLE